jgi:protein-disulfide isomerase
MKRIAADLKTAMRRSWRFLALLPRPAATQAFACSACVCTLAFLVSITAVAAEDAAKGLKDEPGMTRSQADAILDELKQIRRLLEGQVKSAAVTPTPQKRTIRVQSGYSLGSDTAPLTLIEFTDYQCPFCRGFQNSTFDQIRKLYIDTGRLRFISRNLPLDIHPDAMRSAEAALCAGDQGGYWPMRDFLFKSPSLATERILDSAQNLKLDSEVFRACLDGEKHKTEILNDVSEARALQINGTPAFVVGKTTAFGVEGYVTVGALTLAQFDSALKASEAP